MKYSFEKLQNFHFSYPECSIHCMEWKMKKTSTYCKNMKHFARWFHQELTSYFWRVCECIASMTFQTDQDPKKSQIVFDHSEGTNIFVEFIHMVYYYSFVFHLKVMPFWNLFRQGFFCLSYRAVVLFLIKGAKHFCQLVGLLEVVVLVAAAVVVVVWAWADDPCDLRNAMAARIGITIRLEACFVTPFRNRLSIVRCSSRV